MTNLGILRQGKIVSVTAYQNCLACHNTDRLLAIANTKPKFAEGVGCESCHGPSEKWYDRHYQSNTAKQTASSALGLTDSEPLVQRAKICTTCHVGSRDRDMNHDIIAAGHPALYFDMAVYYEDYPKHWRDSDRDDPSFRGRLWLAGEIAMADSELELLESRACKALSISTWPELSNYQCTGCHVTLSGNQRSVDDLNRIFIDQRSVQVRNWNLSGIDSLSAYLHQIIPNAASNFTSSRRQPDSPPNNTPVSLIDAAQKLRSILETANPDSEMVTSFTRSLRSQMHDQLYASSDLSLKKWTKPQQSKLSMNLLNQIDSNSSWESAAKSYTAIWASRTGNNSIEFDRALGTLRRALLFPENSQSPNFPRQSNSKVPPTQEQWNEALLETTSALSKGERK